MTESVWTNHRCVIIKIEKIERPVEHESLVSVVLSFNLLVQYRCQLFPRSRAIDSGSASEKPSVFGSVPYSPWFFTE